jgi:hypothetical protein
MDQQHLCKTCGIVIRWQPTFVEGKAYCCPGCAGGGPCECDYDNLPEPGVTNPLMIHAADPRDDLGSG